jgi:hypothetical protein
LTSPTEAEDGDVDEETEEKDDAECELYMFLQDADKFHATIVWEGGHWPKLLESQMSRSAMDQSRIAAHAVVYTPPDVQQPHWSEIDNSRKLFSFYCKLLEKEEVHFEEYINYENFGR